MADCYTAYVASGRTYMILNSTYTAETCPAAGRVMITSAEWLTIKNGIDNILNSPFVMSPVQGAQIGGAILLVWAVAWVFRVFARFLSSFDSQSSQE